MGLFTPAVFKTAVKFLGEVTNQVQVAAASGAITIKSGVVVLTTGGALSMTLADPATADNGKVLHIICATAQAHVVSNAAGSGFNAGGAASDVCTFAAAIGNEISLVAYGGKWLVINNIGGTLA